MLPTLCAHYHLQCSLLLHSHSKEECVRLLCAGQEQLQLGSQAQTLHSPQPSATHRLQLSPDVVDPLCHGLGHAIFRLALKMQQRPQSPRSPHSNLGADADSSAMQQSSMSSFNLEPFLGTVAGRLLDAGIRFCSCNDFVTCFANIDVCVLQRQSLGCMCGPPMTSQLKVSY